MSTPKKKSKKLQKSPLKKTPKLEALPGGKAKNKKSKEAEKEEGPGGPRISKGANKGEYGSDPNFLKAIEKKFGPIAFDLAANSRNAVCDHFFSKAEDSLKQDWAALEGVLYLNPPFSNIKPWVEKCKAEGDRGANIFFLVPASVGAKWYRANIHKKATVYFLDGRLIFKGQKTPYPKDCMLVHFHKEPAGGYPAPDIWEWRKELKEEEAAA